MGLRSATEFTGVHLGTGIITAVRHADGTPPSPTDKLTILATTPASSLEQSRNNQYGTLSLPGEILLVLASMCSILHLEYVAWLTGQLDPTELPV